MRIRRILIALSVSLIGFWGCSGDPDDGGNGSTDDVAVVTPGDGQHSDASIGSRTSPGISTLPEPCGAMQALPHSQP